MRKMSGLRLRQVLFHAASCGLASALLAVSATAAESAARATVFASADGGDWTVVVRPAERTPRAQPRSIAVPSLPDPVTEPPSAVALPTVVPALAESSELLAVPAASPILHHGQTVAALQPEPGPSLPATLSDDFGVTVQPGPSRTITVNGRTYEDAYRSIPYNQIEYIANPSYRHEAAMELLFGQMRPTTVVRQSAPQAIQNPRVPEIRPYLMTPSEYWSLPPWSYWNSPAGCFWP